MRVQLAGVARHHGAATVLDDVTLTVGPHSRLGLVGPNGVGKTTLLRLIAGLEAPDAGAVSREPSTLAVGYVPQQREWPPGETVLAALQRRTGVAAAQEELERASAAVASGTAGADDRFDRALARFVGLGGGDLEARARAVCADLGLATPLDQVARTLSGGEAARVSLAAILLSRHDVLCLDEPTNDLDFDGLDTLERFVDRYPGALVVVSHDRAFLDRTVKRIVEIDPWKHGVREFAGGWSDYAACRDVERRAAYSAFEQAQQRRSELTELLGTRRTEARSLGAGLGRATGGSDRRPTQALRTKVRQAERMLERTELPDKPFEPWELSLSLAAGERPGSLVAALKGAVAQRGAFRLGPVDLDLVPGECLAITGRNGSGKSTLLGMLLGDVPLVAGHRSVGKRTTIGSIGQGRDPFSGDERLLAAFTRRSDLAAEPARTLLAKFGLGPEHVDRSCGTLSPGERTRAHLAELQAKGVNLLVLDEPTNHLDLEAVEQLESALTGYAGTLVVVSHDRRFLETVTPSRELGL
jgi:ATPase subunit of ABC transporter with duplicated ATPase domains